MQTFAFVRSRILARARNDITRFIISLRIYRVYLSVIERGGYENTLASCSVISRSKVFSAAAIRLVSAGGSINFFLDKVV